MGMDAIALVRIPLDALTQGLAVHGDPKDQVYFGANGMPLRLTALGDASLVWTPFRFASEPDELARGLRALLGEALDAHADGRGVFVFPDVAAPKARDYDAVIEEVGEVGEWVPQAGAESLADRTASAPDGSLEAQLRDMMGAIPPEMLAQLENAMASGDLSALQQLQGQLGGAEGEEGDLAGLSQSLLESLSSQGISLEDLQDEISTMLGADENELQAMMEQAQAQMEELKRTDPVRYAELERALQAQLGGMGRKP